MDAVRMVLVLLLAVVVSRVLARLSPINPRCTRGSARGNRTRRQWTPRLYEYRPPINLSNPRLRRLAAALGPVYMRVSGTWANSTYFDGSDPPAPARPPAGFQRNPHPPAMERGCRLLPRRRRENCYVFRHQSGHARG
jgi:hypothetical protein